MRKTRAQRQPQKRFPWKRALLIAAPPMGCGLAGAAICSKKGSNLTTAIVGKSEVPPEKQMGAWNGAVTGLVLGLAAVQLVRLFRKR